MDYCQVVTVEDDPTTCQLVVPGAGGCKDGEKLLPLDGVVGQHISTDHTEAHITHIQGVALWEKDMVAVTRLTFRDMCNYRKAVRKYVLEYGITLRINRVHVQLRTTKLQGLKNETSRRSV